jgi:hypothetical protein
MRGRVKLHRAHHAGGDGWRRKQETDPGGHKNTSGTPRLHIAHHEASRIRHTGVGEYQVTMHLRVEMLNTQKEMVHVQFLVDGVAQKKTTTPR